MRVCSLCGTSPVCRGPGEFHESGFGQPAGLANTALFQGSLPFRGDYCRQFFSYKRAEFFSYLPVCFDFESKGVPNVTGNESSGKGGRNQMLYVKLGKVYQVLHIIEPYIRKAFR